MKPASEMERRLDLDDAALRRMPESGPLLLLCNRPRGSREARTLVTRLMQRRGDWKVLPDRTFEGLSTTVSLGPGNEFEHRRRAEAWMGCGAAVLAFVGKDLGEGKWGRPGAKAEAGTWMGLARRARACLQVLRLDAGGRQPWLDSLGLGRHLWGRTRDPQGPGLRGLMSAPLRLLDLKGTPGGHEAAELLLLRFWLLAQRGQIPVAQAGPRLRLPAPRQRPIASALPPELLEAELSALPAGARLAVHGELECWVAESPAIPNLLREIGRLREESFRAVGEGTGRPVDLDGYDQHYLHLFLWHRGERAVAGGYRFVPVDRALELHGLDGLYTHSQLRFKPKLLQELEPALELGRSFVAPHFQRGYGPLLLLWKGLGAWIAAHPRYRRLFGLVSMSADFQPLSRELVASFVKQHLFRPDLAKLTRPRRPFRPAYVPGRLDDLTWRLGGDLDEINTWIAELEPDGKGLPVLLRQYAGLGAYFFGFNVDPSFGHALDGLICVDLAHSDPRMLARTMGPEAAKAFLAGHEAGAVS